MSSKISPHLPLLLLVAVIFLARPAHAFGAGNIGSISKVEGVNWRHGDIEDTLLTLITARAWSGRKFSKMDVKRVYFGNWLRDYSQAVDVGAVKFVSAEAVRLLIWVLGFMSFGYGTGEFEVTRDRLGCYRPEEHIDNPKDYADNIDARQYDRRLRGPVDERRELSVDERTGLKHYIATEDIGITTSAGMVRDLLTRCIQLGRRYAQNENEKDFFEALRLLGTANHCLEDYAAHSNYCELALIELGERNVFPHVGRRTQIQLRGARGPVYPLVTGTFGSTDFLSSVVGEVSDKATQTEIQELEGTVKQSRRQDTSLLKELLNKLPSGILGDEDHAGKADQLEANAQAQQMQNMHISPKEPEAFTQQVQQLSRQIYPILEFHDKLIQQISSAIDKIPILPDLIEQLQEQINVFVFSLIAPYVLPIINQVKTELVTGSSEVIDSDRAKQHIVFSDDYSSDPTHSMLSKDHFSNILNEPCGKIASATVAWTVPQVVACWDNPNIDINRTCDRIINGVFHHPALVDQGQDGASDGRRAMFGVVQKWWHSMDERERAGLRQQLSREGVENGKNVKPGVHDSGHGCGKPLGMPTLGTSQSSGAIGGLPVGAIMGALGSGGHGGMGSSIGSMAGNAVGGGALGAVVGGIASTVGDQMLGDNFQGANKHSYQQSQQGRDGSHTDRYGQVGHQQGGPHQQERYGQAEMRHTQHPDGGYQQQYSRYEQDGPHGQTGYGFQQTTNVRPTHDGGYEQRTERRYEHPGGTWDSEVQQQRVDGYGRQEYHEEQRHGRKKKDDSDDDDDDDDDDSGDDFEKKQRKARKKEEKRMGKEREKEEKRMRKQRDDSDDDERRGGGRRRQSHGSGGGGSPRHERRHESGGGFGDFFGGNDGGGRGRGGHFGGGGRGGGRGGGGGGGGFGDMIGGLLGGGGGGGGGRGGRGGHRGRGEFDKSKNDQLGVTNNRAQDTELHAGYDARGN